MISSSSMLQKDSLTDEDINVIIMNLGAMIDQLDFIEKTKNVRNIEDLIKNHLCQVILQELLLELSEEFYINN